MRGAWGVVILGVLFHGQSAEAFWIRDHNLVTAQAIQGLQLCGFLPAGWDEGWQRALAEADSAEDTNLFRKWTRYSHYFNPDKKLAMWRADSSVTIQETTDSLAELLQEAPESRDLHAAFSSLGRIAHHLQDMAVPAHVVPVNHFVDDGFEKYDLPDLAALPLYSPADCASLDGRTPPLELLETTARETLAAVEESVAYAADDQPQAGKWSTLFWAAGEGGDFGAYGAFGNQFGASAFQGPQGERIAVADTAYSAFKRRQMREAVLATERAILWLTAALWKSP